MRGDLESLEELPCRFYNFHPGKNICETGIKGKYRIEASYGKPSKEKMNLILNWKNSSIAIRIIGQSCDPYIY